MVGSVLMGDRGGTHMLRLGRVLLEGIGGGENF